MFPFLDGLDEAERETAELVLTMPDLTEEEVDESLVDMLDSDRYSAYLEWKEQNKLPPDQKLLNSVIPKMKGLCGILLKKKNFPALRKALANAPPQVQELIDQIEELELECQQNEESNAETIDASSEATTSANSNSSEGSTSLPPPPPYSTDQYDSQMAIGRKTAEFLKDNDKLKGIELLTKTRICIGSENNHIMAMIFGSTQDAVSEAETYFLKILTEQKKLLSSPLPLQRHLSDAEKVDLFKITGCIGVSNEKDFTVKFFARPEFEAAKLHLDALVGQPSSSSKQEEVDCSELGASLTVRPTHREGKKQRYEKKESSIVTNASEFDGDSGDEILETNKAADEDDETELHFEQLPEETVILVIGETGVGKSTWINAIPNYLKYGHIEDALSDTTVLIESRFHLQERLGNGRFKKKTYNCTPTVVGNQQSSNEVLEVGDSSTQYPKSYVFKWTVNGVEKRVTLIDTPGIGDCRGTETDAQNFGKIMNFIADNPYIHGILILVPPNANKLTTSFKYCIDELLVHLDHAAANNILFGFTCCKATDYRPGETLAILERHLENLKQKNPNLSISLERSCFSFENEGFRYLIAKNNGHRFEEEECRSYTYSYEKSRRETRRLFAHIAKMIPHNVANTLSLNNCRNIIFKLAEPMAKITQNIDLNIKLIYDKMEEVEQLEDDCGSLLSKLYIEQECLTIRKIDYPKTVCTASSCSELKTVDGRTRTIYSQECHSPCNLTYVSPEEFPCAALLRCTAMDTNGNCQKCGHSWNTHMHIRYELVEKRMRVYNDDNANSIVTKKSGIEARRIFMETTKTKLDKLEKDKERLTHFAAAFTTYVKQNSIVPYNDSYVQYMNFLITQEKAAASFSGDGRNYKRLLESKRVYEEQLRLLKDSTPDGNKKYTEQDINGMFEQLKSMPCGDLLESIKEIELLAVRDIKQFNSTNIPMPVTSGFIARPSRRSQPKSKLVYCSTDESDFD